MIATSSVLVDVSKNPTVLTSASTVTRECLCNAIGKCHTSFLLYKVEASRAMKNTYQNSSRSSLIKIELPLSWCGACVTRRMTRV